MKVEDYKVIQCEAATPLVAPEGNLVAIEYSLAGKPDTFTIGLPTEAAKLLHYHLGLALSASTAPGFVRMTEITDARAGVSEHPGKVVLTLTTDGGTVHHYLVPKEDSASLRPQLRSAEAASSSKVRLPRA